MSDVYICKGEYGGWSVWNPPSKTWTQATLPDLVGASMLVDAHSGNYHQIDFKKSFNSGDRSGPIEWNSVKNIWQLKAGESIYATVQNAGNKAANTEISSMSAIDADAVEELLQAIKDIVNQAPDQKIEIKNFIAELRLKTFRDLKDEAQSVTRELVEALQGSYQKLDDGVEEMLEKVLEMKVPALDYKKELRIFRESLEETVKSALREELRPLVEGELSKEPRVFEVEEVDKEVIKAQLREELEPIIRAELVYELRQKQEALEERPQLSKVEQEKILDDARARLIASVGLNGIEIREIKATLARDVQLSDLDVKEQKKFLRSQIELKEKDEIEQIRKQVLEQDGYESLSAFRKSTVNDQRDIVIKELRRTIRPIVEGSLRKELTLLVLREIATDTKNVMLSDVAKQLEYSLRQGLADEVRKQELQNALFHVREIIEAMDLDESTKYEIIIRIEQETRMPFISKKPISEMQVYTERLIDLPSIPKNRFD